MAIDAARVHIRPWKTDDIDALHRLVRASQTSLSRWLAWCHTDYDANDAQAWINHSMKSWADQSAFPFAIIDSDTKALLGGAGLSQLDIEHRQANLGYWIGSPFTGRGVATAAANLLAQFGFKDIKLKRIEIRVLPDNHASLAVARKLGAQRAGVLRDGILLQGEPRDAVIYSLSAEDLSTRLAEKSIAYPHDQ